MSNECGKVFAKSERKPPARWELKVDFEAGEGPDG
jgi:hypothetical protein